MRYGVKIDNKEINRIVDNLDNALWEFKKLVAFKAKDIGIRAIDEDDIEDLLIEDGFCTLYSMEICIAFTDEYAKYNRSRLSDEEIAMNIMYTIADGYLKK